MLQASPGLGQANGLRASLLFERAGWNKNTEFLFLTTKHTLLLAQIQRVLSFLPLPLPPAVTETNLGFGKKDGHVFSNDQLLPVEGALHTTLSPV